MSGRWLVMLAPLLVSVAASGQPTELVLQSRQGTRSLLSVDVSPQDRLDPSWVKVHFASVLLHDLQQSGAFELKAPDSSSAAPVVHTSKASPAGPDLVLKVRLGRNAGIGYSATAEVVDPRAGQPIYSKQYSGEEILLRRMAHRLVDDLIGRTTGIRGVADSRILFARQVGPGVKEIFQVDRDGTAPRQLTRLGSLTITPTVSIDGRLAFLTYKSGGPEIWGQAKEGFSFTRLYPFHSSHGLTVSTPVWSPDGKRLAFVEGDRRGNTNIKTLELDSRKVHQLTANSGLNTEPAWDPSGMQITFTSDRDGSPQVYLMEADGSNIRKLTSEGKYNASPAWSPDGSMIAYVSRFDLGFDLFVYKLAEGRAYQLTRGPGSSESPAWSPDGRFLAYSNTASGTSRLYLTDLSGGEPQLLTDLTPAQSPEWTRSR